MANMRDQAPVHLRCRANLWAEPNPSPDDERMRKHGLSLSATLFGVRVVGGAYQLLARTYRPQGVEATVLATGSKHVLGGAEGSAAAPAPALSVDAVAAMSADGSDVVVR